MYPVVAVSNSGDIYIAKDSVSIVVVDTGGVVIQSIRRPSGNLLAIRIRESLREIELVVVTSKRRATVFRTGHDSIQWRKVRSFEVPNLSVVEKLNMNERDYDSILQQVSRCESQLPPSMVRDGLLYAQDSITIWFGIGFRTKYLVDIGSRVIYQTQGLWAWDEIQCPKSSECFNISRWRGYEWVHGKLQSVAMSSNRVYCIWAFLDRDRLWIGRMITPYSVNDVH
jgi:hypothetical protein